MTTTESNQTPTPNPTCMQCEEPADGLDRFCTPCRAESACTNLTIDLTNALENFLDARWSPHEFGRSRPAYYLEPPHEFELILPEIEAAYDQIVAGAQRLIKLAIGQPVVMESGVEFYGSDLGGDIGGFNAYVQWDFK